MLIKKWKKDSKLPVLVGSTATCFINGFKTLYDDDMYEHEIDEYKLHSLERVQIQLGFSGIVTEGYYAEILPSEIKRWKGLNVIISQVDSKYIEEWKVVVVNLSSRSISLQKGDEICKFILCKTIDFTLDV